jgi:hypothetical protein
MVYTLSMQTQTVSTISPRVSFRSSLIPTHNYSIVHLSYHCDNYNMDMFEEHLNTITQNHGYTFEKNVNPNQRRFQLLISNSKTMGETEADVSASMHTLARKFVDKLSISIEEIQEDAIVWYSKIIPINNTETL